MPNKAKFALSVAERPIKFALSEVEWAEPISRRHSVQERSPLKIIRILALRHLTNKCNSLKYWFSY
jgi:hypothetical protein